MLKFHAKNEPRRIIWNVSMLERNARERRSLKMLTNADISR
jgi:hypothetical protein